MTLLWEWTGVCLCVFAVNEPLLFLLDLNDL